MLRVNEYKMILFEIELFAMKSKLISEIPLNELKIHFHIDFECSA